MEKWIKYLLIICSIALLIGGIYIGNKLSYKGDNKIILLNDGQDYISFNNIIQRPAFKNKVVYVDVWGTSCPPCFAEFKNYTPQLTKRYKDSAGIAFLYICIDRHAMPAIRWKEKIKFFQPAGYHILVKAKEEQRLAIDIIGQALYGQYFPYQPCYFIVNKKGEIVKRPTLDSDEGEFEPSTTNRLYHKLDSLRHL